MKVIFSSNRNPHFETFTEYIEKAFKENNCDVLFFENRDFVIPGRARDRVVYLQKWDLQRLNKKLISMAQTYRPDIFLEAGGWNILQDTVESMKKIGIKTALWTVDTPRIFEPIINVAPHYDYVFTQGSEAYEILKKYNINNLYWMPFACDPDFHKPIDVSDEEDKRYGCDVCFVGSGGDLYPQRHEFLENLVDFDLGIWGPGWETLPKDSPLKKCIRGGQTRPDEWVKIFSASKIVFHSHYKDPEGKVPCYQASPRIFEVLACGSLLIVDEQKDVLTLFKPGEHLVVFKDIDDLRKKVSYYLQHPDKARRIAEQGKREVLEKHTYRQRIKNILEVMRQA